MSSRTSTHPQCLHGNITLKLFDNVVCLFDTMLCYLTQQSIFGARRKFISSNDICNATSQMKHENIGIVTDSSLEPELFTRQDCPMFLQNDQFLLLCSKL